MRGPAALRGALNASMTALVVSRLRAGILGRQGHQYVVKHVTVHRQKRLGDLERKDRRFLVSFKGFGPSYEWRPEKDVVSVNLIMIEGYFQECDKSEGMSRTGNP